MRLQTFLDWTVFNLGFVIAPTSGIYVGIGPLLVRLVWRPFNRCDLCGRKMYE